MEKILAVVTKEKKYAQRLCDYVNQKNSMIFTAVPFETLETCSAFGKRHNIEILLVDSELAEPGRTIAGMNHSVNLESPDSANCSEGFVNIGIRDIHANKILKLSNAYSFDKALADEPQKRKGKNFGGALDNISFGFDSIEESEVYAAAAAFAGGPDTIHKYQPAENILREVMNRCEGMDLLKASESFGRPIRLIGVYSPVSRCGKTSFALTLSRILSERKTLYLNLEEFSGMEILTGETYALGLSDAIYHMKQGTLTSQKIYSMIYTFSGIDYIPPIRYAEDRNAVSGSDFLQLINLILQNTLYENVVIDMDRFADEASDILEICDDIYMPVLDNYLDLAKVEQFLEYLRSSGRAKLVDRIVRFETPDPVIRRSNTSFIESLVYGEMGDMIRNHGWC